MAGHFERGSGALSTALSLGPESQESRYELAKHFMRFGHFELALPHLVRLQRTAPFRKTWPRLLHCLSKVRMLPPLDMDRILVEVLRGGGVDEITLAPLLGAYLDRRHDFERLESGAIATWLPALASDELFLLYLTRSFNVHPAIEPVLGRLRTHFARSFRQCTARGPEWGLRVRLALALANSEYAVPESEQDPALRTACVEALHGTDAPASWPAAVALASYERPDPANLRQLAEGSPKQDAMRLFLQRFYEEPLELAKEDVELPPDRRLGEQAEATRRVRTQYTECPFPRWCGVVPRVAEKERLGDFLARRFPGLDRPVTPLPRLLFAGCGTGREVCAILSRFDAGPSLAVDLSLTSLAYAQRAARSLGHAEGQIRFVCADLHEADGWDTQFEVVHALGVLHHTPDPFESWAILRRRVSPQGFMKVGLYSQVARERLSETRAWLKSQGWSTTFHGLREFRRKVMAEGCSGRFGYLLNVGDFYNLCHLRDLLFHEVEHCHTLPEIRRASERLGLRFLGFETQDRRVFTRYQARYPDDPAGTNLENWSQFEAEFPRTFLGMYVMWFAAD